MHYVPSLDMLPVDAKREIQDFESFVSTIDHDYTAKELIKLCKPFSSSELIRVFERIREVGSPALDTTTFMDRDPWHGWSSTDPEPRRFVIHELANQQRYDAIVDYHQHGGDIHVHDDRGRTPAMFSLWRKPEITHNGDTTVDFLRTSSFFLQQGAFPWETMGDIKTSEHWVFDSGISMSEQEALRFGKKVMWLIQSAHQCVTEQHEYILLKREYDERQKNPCFDDFFRRFAKHIPVFSLRDNPQELELPDHLMKCFSTLAPHVVACAERDDLDVLLASASSYAARGHEGPLRSLVTAMQWAECS